MAEKQEAVVEKFIARMDEWAKWLESDAPTTVERDQIVAACERVASAGMSKQEKPVKSSDPLAERYSSSPAGRDGRWPESVPPQFG